MEENRESSERQIVLVSQTQDASSNQSVTKKLADCLSEAQQHLETLKKEQESLKRERDEAVSLRTGESWASSSSHPQDFSQFSDLEIREATQGFDSSMNIGEGGFGRVYRGLLRHTPVAIKILDPDSLQGPCEFQREVDVLIRVRHPNLVTLIGTCPEEKALIYEYLPNGSLEDRLFCKDNSAPLSWQIRICILYDICAALVFLHSNKPHSIIHGDLKPANILLDANLVAKISDFGLSRLILHNPNTSPSSRYTTRGWRTDPKGTFFYIDPEFQATGILTPKSDVYSFGVIILQVLTGKSAFGVIPDVREALADNWLNKVLDMTAGDWIYVQAKQLARLGLRCCAMNQRDRPDLESDVWRTIGTMRAAVGSGLPFLRSGFLEESRQAPSYFICPIFQEIMKDPHVAADGFTYEAEAIHGWIEGGHNTSPMTNLKLDNLEFIPNLTLRSAIQEWLQQQ